MIKKAFLLLSRPFYRNKAYIAIICRCAFHCWRLLLLSRALLALAEIKVTSRNNLFIIRIKYMPAPTR